MRKGVVEKLKKRWRLALAGAVLAAVVVGFLSPGCGAREDLAGFLGERFEVEVTPESVHLIGERPWAGALAYQDVVFLASRPDEPRDLYRAAVRTTPAGRPIAARGVANLTRSSAGDEDQVVVDGTAVATRTSVSGRYTAVTLVDLAGEAESISSRRSGLWPLLWAVRNTIEFGTRKGVERHGYQLLNPADEVEMELSGGSLSLVIDDLAVETGDGWEPEESQQVVDHSPPTAVNPSLVPFAVDTVRLVPWIGPRGIEWMEHVFFAGLDLGRRAMERVSGPSGQGDEAVREMAVADEQPPRPGHIDIAELPEVGFPPANLRPIRDDPGEGEGEWRVVTDERFIRLNPGAPPAFATTYLRPDRERGFARTFIVVWDPRQIELYPVAGTVEPMSATGVRGSGLVPREQADRMVAGFNGGFQATHGEYGMMMEGTLFIPPKGYGATVASLADGATGLGTWNEVVDRVPPEIVAFRQNMTALVQDGEVNPFRRDWWGAAPPGAANPTFTQRSGVCLTEEGFVAYLWGPSLSPESLGEAMLATRCVHGVHLDMNAVLTGFEFYHVAIEGELPELGRQLEDGFEGEGAVPQRQDLVFRSRRLARGMQHMNFPRYIRRDTRDFFWLRLRNILPGPDLEPVVSPAADGEGVWRISGLPVGGFPPAFARTFVRPDERRPDLRVELVKVDAKVVRAAVGRRGSWPVVEGAKILAAIQPGAEAGLAAGAEAMGKSGVGLVGSPTVRPACLSTARGGEEAPAPAGAILGAPLTKTQTATVALAPHPDGFMVAALAPEGDGPLLAAALRLAGTDPDDAIALGAEADLVFFAGEGSERRAATLSGREPPLYGDADALLLVDNHGPMARRIFPDTPAVPPSRWNRFLNKRQVYLRSEDGTYRHVTGVELPRQAPMVLKKGR